MLKKYGKRKWIFILSVLIMVFTLFNVSLIALAGSDTVVRIEAYNYSGYFIRHIELEGKLSADPVPVYDSYFIERTGLASSSGVSYEAVNYPGYYLRHESFALVLAEDDGSTLFAQDATFNKVSGLADSSYVSFQSYNYPTRYIRHADFACSLTTISSTLDQQDATFKITEISDTMSNPVDSVERPDPWVYKHTDGCYYGMHTVMEDGAYIPELKMYKSSTLSDIFDDDNGTVIWEAPTGEWNSENVWAPELHRINETWYIYYSAGLRIGVLSNTNSDPTTGTWVDQGMISDDVWAIDGTVLEQNDNLYLLWSGQNNAQVINITQMSSPTALTGSTVQLSAPTYDWELHGDYNVNEGPEILQTDDTTYCIYSASYCATQYYCLGMLSIDVDDDPMDADNWTKSSTPVFQMSTENGIYGTGHSSFTKSPDGTEDWIVYHGTLIASDEYQTRYAFMQEFGWNSDGTPNFGVPVGRYNSIPKPSGE